MQGPKPSLTHITLPQLRQLGAAARRGCRAPMQLHFRLELSWRVLLVLISRVRIAASSSFKIIEAPCMDVPPVIFILVCLVGFDGAGEAVRELVREEGLLLLLKSEIKGPAAEGGALGVGAWITDGWDEREKVLAEVEGVAESDFLDM